MSAGPPPIPPPSPGGQPCDPGHPAPAEYGGQAGQYQQYPQQGGYPQQQGYPSQGYPQQAQYAQQQYYYQQQAPETHSTPGKIAVALGCVGFLVFGVSFIAATLAGPTMDENSPQAQLIVLGILGAMGLNLLGIFLSIGAFLEKNKKHAFAWVGLLMNAVPCLCGLGVMALGLVAMATGMQP